MGAVEAPPSSTLTARWAVFVVLWAVLGGVIPALLITQVPNVGRSSGWLLTLALIVWSGARLAHRIATGRPELFDFVFWLFTYVFMALAPTVQMRADQPSTTTPGMLPEQDVRTAAVVWLGVLCYEVGRFWAGRGRRHAEPEHAPAAPVLDVVPARAVVLTVIGVLAAAYYVSRIGVGTLFMSRYTAYSIRSERMPDVATRSIVSAAGSYPLLIAIGVYVRLWVTRALGSRSAQYLPFAAIATFVLLVVTNPISSARYDFGTVAFALVVFAGVMGTPARARLAMAGTVLALLFVFPVADAFRSENVDVRRAGFFGEYLGNADYDGFWQIGNALSFFDDGLVRPFRQAAGVLLFWVPRGVWPDKPADTGIVLAEYRGYGFTNLSAPLWAELVVNGGIALLVVGFVALGFALRRLDRRATAALLGGGLWWAIIGAVFPFYMVILLRGSLLQATGTFVVALAATLFVRAGRSAQPRAPATTSE